MSPAGKNLSKLIQKAAAKAKAKNVPQSKASSKSNRKSSPVEYPSDSSSSSSSSSSGKSTSSDDWSIISSSDSSAGSSDSSNSDTSGTPVSLPSLVLVPVLHLPDPCVAIRNPANIVRRVRRRNTDTSHSPDPKVFLPAHPSPGPSANHFLSPGPRALGSCLSKNKGFCDLLRPPILTRSPRSLIRSMEWLLPKTDTACFIFFRNRGQGPKRSL